MTYTGNSPIYAFATTFTTDDERIRIPKLKGTENYRPWSIYVQATLESKACWDIVIGTRKAPPALDTNASDDEKKEHREYTQSHATAKSILVLSIDPSILTDDCATNSAKQIWDAYTAQYKEKGFVLRFTLFIHLVTTKVASFKSITAYNADFQITIDKLSSSGENLPADLRLAAYLHGIEATYPDFAAAQRSSARSKIPELSTVMAELEDEGRQARAVESTALPIRSKEGMRRRQNQGPTRGGHAKGSSSTLRPKGSKDKCAHCDSTGHSEDSFWKKYPERAPAWWNKDGPSNSKPDGRYRGRKDGVTFNLAAVAGTYDHDSASRAFPVRVNEMGSRWNIDTGCTDHMCNFRSYFVNYRAVHRPTTIQGAGGVLSAIGIGNIPLTVETRSGERNDVLLVGVLPVPGLFTNLISGSELLKRGYYLHCGN